MKKNKRHDTNYTFEKVRYILAILTHSFNKDEVFENGFILTSVSSFMHGF